MDFSPRRAERIVVVLILAIFGRVTCTNSATREIISAAPNTPLPYFDLVVAVHVIEGNSSVAVEEITNVRRS